MSQITTPYQLRFAVHSNLNSIINNGSKWAATNARYGMKLINELHLNSNKEELKTAKDLFDVVFEESPITNGYELGLFFRNKYEGIIIDVDGYDLLSMIGYEITEDEFSETLIDNQHESEFDINDLSKDGEKIFLSRVKNNLTKIINKYV